VNPNPESPNPEPFFQFPVSFQIHGGYDYIKDFPVERYLRDAKICEIGGGTWELQKRIIGGELMRTA